MPVQAIPLALAASLYPFGLAVLLLLAEAERYRGRVTVFLAGAAICTLAVGFAVAFALHGAALGNNGQQTPRYGLKLAIGVAFCVAVVVLARRPRTPKAGSGESRVTRAARHGGLLAALAAGIVLYLPSPAYLSAEQDVGSKKLSTAATAAWVVIVAHPAGRGARGARRVADHRRHRRPRLSRSGAKFSQAGWPLSLPPWLR